MLKKTTTAVITALATILSTVSPLAVYAENSELVHTSPERTINQELHPYATAPAVLDNQPAQTTAVASTIPDREHTMTNILDVEIQPDAFPIKNKTDVTVSVVDGDTGEKIEGVNVHLVETDNINSSVIKRDFGTWNTSDSENYVLNDVEYTLTGLNSMFVMTAYLENIPEGYTYQGSYSPIIADRMIDSGTGRYYNFYDPVDTFTIELDKEYKGSFQAECSVIDIRTGEKIKGAEVALEEWGIDGNLKNTQSWITSGEKADIVDVDYVLPADYFNETFDFRVCKLPEDYDHENMTSGLIYSVMINKNTSGIVEFNVYLYPSGAITTAPEGNESTQTDTTTVITDIPEKFRECEKCGKTIHVDNGVITPLGLFICPDCKSSGVGGTRPQFTDNESTGTVTATTVDFITCGHCQKEIKISEAVSTRLGLLICTDCQSTGVGGTRPYFPAKTTIYASTDIATITTTTTATMECKMCQSCGSIMYAEYGITTPDGMFICPYCYSQDTDDIGLYNEVNTNGGKIVHGDSNCDDDVNVADAVFIMQCLTNPNEYKLSEWGKINADVCNRGDGVTAMDALVLQMVGIGVYSLSDLPITL